MKRIIMLSLLLVCISFGQDMIVRVYAPSKQSLKVLSPKYNLDIAAARAGEWYDIVADDQLLSTIMASGLKYEITVENISEIKDAVRANYLSYTQTNDSLRKMALNYPSICKLDSLPLTTYQGRWIYGVKISDNPGIEEDNEPGMLVDGLHHSREWACIPMVLFFADSILKAYGSVPQITNIINTTELYCFPLINVDGYVYDYPSQLSWRKNREPFGGSIGTDCNRNYGGCGPNIAGDWGAVDEGQASHYPSDITFCGAYVNSGDETRALTMYAKTHTCNAYMTYHSYSELLMWPWGWTGTPPPDSLLYSRIGNTMANMISRLGGGTYGRGSIYSAIYPVSGGSLDWVYSWSHWVNGTSNLSFTTEIGTSFYQPVSDLNFILHENFDALLYLADFCDSIVYYCEGAVPPPTIYQIDTVGPHFTVSWHAKNTYDNHPTKWELVELSGPSVIVDSLESGTSRWLLDGFTLSTARAHSGTHSFFSGSSNNMNTAARSTHPYVVQAGDSVKFWCWYNLENNYDVAVVEVSENTKEWFNLDTTRFTGTQTSWVRKAYSLNSWVGKSVYIRFRAMTDEYTLNEGFYVDDIYPSCLFANVDTISSNITDTVYEFSSHAIGNYDYYVRGYNTAWGWGDYSCLEDVAVTTAPSGPFLALGSLELNDAGANGQANPGEIVDLGIWARNIGVDTAYDVYGLLSESDPYVALTIDSSWYGDIPEDDSALSNPYYKFTVANNCPNLHAVSFDLVLHDVNDSTWTSHPGITVYAPILSFVNVSVVDDDNGNGSMDPGETGNLVVTLRNDGDAVAENVTSTLATTSPYVTITDNAGSFGSINPDVTATNAADPYTIIASAGTPTGTIASFSLVVNAGVYCDTLAFDIVIGKKQFYVWNPDKTPSPGQKTDSLLLALGYSGDYGTTLVPDLTLYQSVFVCLGIYSNNYVIKSTSAEAARLVDYLQNQNGRVYMEGGDVWFYDPMSAGGYDFGPLFGITGLSDGTGDLGPVVGETSAFTNSMSFNYGGENSFIDHINPAGTGFLIFHDGNNAYNCGVANNPGTRRTVGTSFELGLLTDATAPSTRTALLDSIMNFFGIVNPTAAVPPSSPYIYCTKSSDNVVLRWNKVTTDTLGSPITIDHYAVYRDTSPSFNVNTADSIGYTYQNDTDFVDTNALNHPECYYYLVRAVDNSGNESKKSNMGYKFNKFFNENANTTSRNLVALPWHSNYSTASDLTNDLSPTGNPLIKITNLLQLPELQAYENWLWDPDFTEWYGSNFTIVPGCAYEMLTIRDTSLFLVGSNNPNGLIQLYHNTTTTSRNWVSLPYDAIYEHVSDITGDYSQNGYPINKFTNLRDDNLYESWLWDPDFGEWYGSDFAIERGRGYEFVTMVDTTWNPTEYSNDSGPVASNHWVRARTTHCGTSSTTERGPVWSMDNEKANLQTHNATELDVAPISHIVYAHIGNYENVILTAYRLFNPYDVLTEDIVGCGTAVKGDRALVWFDVGNFKTPWRDGEEVILIVEGLKDGHAYYAVQAFTLNVATSVQNLGELMLVPILERADNVLGYSLYKNGRRVNDRILDAYDSKTNAVVRPVIRGGYETVYGSGGCMTYESSVVANGCIVNPNPFADCAFIEYSVAERGMVDVTVYDVTGRSVVLLARGIRNPGNYSVTWYGCDRSGRRLSSGVYFIRFTTGAFSAQHKLLLVK